MPAVPLLQDEYSERICRLTRWAGLDVNCMHSPLVKLPCEVNVMEEKKALMMTKVDVLVGLHVPAHFMKLRSSVRPSVVLTASRN